MKKWVLIENPGKQNQYICGYFKSYEDACRYARGIYGTIYTIREVTE